LSRAGFLQRRERLAERIGLRAGRTDHSHWRKSEANGRWWIEDVVMNKIRRESGG